MTLARCWEAGGYGGRLVGTGREAVGVPSIGRAQSPTVAATLDMGDPDRSLWGIAPPCVGDRACAPARSLYGCRMSCAFHTSARTHTAHRGRCWQWRDRRRRKEP